MCGTCDGSSHLTQIFKCAVEMRDMVLFGAAKMGNMPKQVPRQFKRIWSILI